MIVFDYKLEEFEKLYKVTSGFFSNNSIIVDNELMNDISEDWDYEKGKPCVVGILHKDFIKILVAEKENDKAFKDSVIYYLHKLGESAMLYAFNKYVEMGNFKGFMKTRIPIEEIKPFNAKGWNKDKFFTILVDNKVIPFVIIKDVFKGNAGMCIIRWEEYLRTGNKTCLYDIVSHNINCLLKESVILKNRSYFIENYKVDKKGWLIPDKK